MPPEYLRPYGLTSVSLASPNPRRSAEFYSAVLDSHAVAHDDGFVQIKTPGSSHLTIFERANDSPGRLSGAAHFGFRLESPEHLELAAKAVKAAGGEVIEHAELVAGQPCVFARDPDGYMFEMWYEGSPAR